MVKNTNLALIQKHPFHLVDPSPWPLLTALSTFGITSGGVLYMHSYKNGGLVMSLGLLCTLYCMGCWWRDVVREATFEGHHTSAVQVGLRYGMILFIISEIMFFFGFFWAFFHASLSPTLEIGGIWPPQGIAIFDPWHIPFLNTLILLLSGSSVTWSHHAIVHGFRKEAIISLIITLVLAVIFTGLQGFEYVNAQFNISDSVYGTTFYLCTGFHGFHVIVGTLFLSVCLIRIFKYHLTKEHHFGFEAAAWYWHFVDVVWLFLFISIYWWGGV